MVKSFKIQVNGQVQGVGFRPFVFGLATKHKLKGTVYNNENGVEILINTTENKVPVFLKDLLQDPPPSSIIIKHKVEEIPFHEFEKFSIDISKSNFQINSPLTPDFAICKDCKKELESPDNRRYQYPFITCVNCGPRYALTKKFPFERNNTSISDFKMCAVCQKEYKNPKDRRFHSQTNSCTSCGIKLSIRDNKGNDINIPEDRIIKEVCNQIKNGKIVSIKNTSGYFLCCDARNKNSIQKLRERKQRPTKPFAVLYPNIQLLKNDLIVSPFEEEELGSAIRPIVLISSVKYTGPVALNEIAPSLNQIGVMLPYSGLMQLLMKELKTPIVATSGNIHGSPIISNIEEAQKKLGSVADLFLHHNLHIENPQDDSVVKFIAHSNHKIIFRRSRGYAPNYLGFNSISEEKILAVGSLLKSTVAFTPNSNLYLSEYIGNLDSYECFNRFEKINQKYFNFFNTDPSIILADKHTGYQSTIYAQELAGRLNTEIKYIQHHKAHFASVLGEYNLFDSEVNKYPEGILGVIWDGTGLGDDGNIWGGEFFIYKHREISRYTHLEYYDWLSNDKMALEPRLTLLSLAGSQLEDFVKNKFSESEWQILSKMKNKNSLKTSSVGRLFDAVSSLLGLCDYNTYEGEAAILLENHIINYKKYQLKDYLEKHEIFSGTQILNQISIDLIRKIPTEHIAANFLYTLSCTIFKVANKTNSKIIALSGGVFQNSILCEMLYRQTTPEIELKFNRNLSVNDENISYGQMMYYQYINN